MSAFPTPVPPSPAPARPLDVAIVGAGPVGLALAALLARHGLTARVFEKRDGLHRDPQAHVINTRTMEILRELGVEPAVQAGATPPILMRNITWCESLAGRELGRIRLQGDEAGALVRRLALSPTSIANLAQNRLEPLLLEAVAGSARVDVRFASEVTAVAEDASGARVTVRDAGGEHEEAASFVVACDGAGSAVRRALGIAMDGPASLQQFVSIYFEADLTRWIGARQGPLFWIAGARTRGVVIGFDLVKTWCLMVPFAEPATVADFTGEVVRRLVADAIGDARAAFRITSVGNWNMSAQVAASYRAGRVFLVGDAAHRFPPTGGLGMNTGIQDAHNLAWKLAAVLEGAADHDLLDTYELERRSVAIRNTEQSLRNAMRMIEVDMALGVPTLAAVDPAAFGHDGQPLLDFGLDGDGPEATAKRAAVQQVIESQAEHFDFTGLDLGVRYDDGAVLADGTDAPPDDVRTYVPAARPGSRLPHAWLVRLGRRVSTLDVAGAGRFTLVAGDRGAPWEDAARRLVRGTGFDLGLVTIVAPETARPGCCIDADGQWAAVSGLSAGGALLVRPDGHVAWRIADAAGMDAGACFVALSRALSALLGPRFADRLEDTAA